MTRLYRLERLQRLNRLPIVLLLCVAGACGVTGSEDGGEGASSRSAPPAGDGLGDGEVAGDGGGDGDASGSRGASAGGFATEADSAGGADPSSGMSGVGDSAGSGSGLQAGVLTAGAWDDNRNFEHFSAYRDEIAKLQLPGAPGFSDEDHLDAQALFGGDRDARQTLDIALVIDTTGSMGDEIAYLQTEFDAISASIEAAYPNAEQRWSLVVYRDTTDEYVVRWFDFRGDAGEFRDKLGGQSANGGGDFPEAADAALDTMTQLAWRGGPDNARIAFWVADAPHHDEMSGVLTGAIRDAQMLGIHIYPVASSGIDDLTELSMRSAAQLTGGRYLFLTDDSGVGGAHAEPSVPCYFVTRLDHAILRMVDIELSGVYREPDESDIVRTGGDPTDGSCTLESGAEVSAF